VNSRSSTRSRLKAFSAKRQFYLPNQRVVRQKAVNYVFFVSSSNSLIKNDCRGRRGLFDSAGSNTDPLGELGPAQVPDCHLGTIRRKVAGRQLCVMGKRAVGCAFGLNAVSIARHIVRKQKPSCRPAPTVCAGKCCTARSCLALRSPTCSLQRTIRPRTQDHHNRLANAIGW
jgi:hypothetical protein